MANVQFFGDVDRNRDGNVTSAMPAWYFDVHIEEMEESIARKERSIKRGDMPQTEMQYAREELERERKRLLEIKNSMPDIADVKDKLAKSYKKIEEQLREALPTRSEDKMGLVSPYEELRQMKKACISISPEVAKMCGFKADHAKVSRDQAVRCYKMIGKLLGENTNIERIRRDNNYGTYRSMDEMTEMIIKKVRGEQ